MLLFNLDTPEGTIFVKIQGTIKWLLNHHPDFALVHELLHLSPDANLISLISQDKLPLGILLHGSVLHLDANG